MLALHDDNTTDTLFSETLTRTSFVDRLTTFAIPAGETQRLVFRHISDDKYMLFIDDVAIHQGISYYVHDTTIVRDTIINTEYVHDTTVVTLTDTLDNYIHDTVTLSIYDTLYLPQYIHDTMYTSHDTVYLPQYIYDTISDGTRDTLYLPQYIYDTVSNTEYVHDTVDNFVYDTLTVTDTLWLTRYDTIYLPLYIYDTVYIHDTMYVGVDDVEVNSVKLYQRDGRIVVEGAEGQRVMVFDAVGRVVASTHSSALTGTSPNLGEEFGWRVTFDVPTTGVYLVKVGDAPARRIVVVR